MTHAKEDSAPRYEQIRREIAREFEDPTSLPKVIFSDPDVYREELKRIFYGPYWHPVAHRAELRRPNGFKTSWLAEIPLLISRGSADEIRVFVNSCTHRGTLLEQRPCGEATEFECPYHRWLFGSDGGFRGAPGRKEFRLDFRDEDYALRPLRVAEHCGLIFVTLDPDTPSLEDFLAEAAGPLTDAMLDDGRLTLLGYQRVIYQSNWKTYIDNDPYHAPLLHKAFQLLGWQGAAGRLIATDPHGHMCILYQVQRYTNNGFLHDPSVVEFLGKDDRARVVALRPVTGITKHVDTINVRFARPLGPDRTEVHYAFFGHETDDPGYGRHRVRQSSNLLGPSGFISIEDAAVYNRVQATAGDGGHQRFVKGVGKPQNAWTQNDEVSNTVWWAHYRKVMGFAHF